MEQEAKRNGGYAGFGATATATAPAAAGYEVPPAPPIEAPPVGAPMTVNDVVVKTAAMFIPLLATAYVAWTMQVGFGVVLVAMLGALGLALWQTMAKTVQPVAVLGYAALEGIVIGGMSFWLQEWVNQSNAAAGEPSTNIVVQAVIGTFAAFAAMLFLYGTRIIKVTGRFKTMMMTAMLAYLGIAVASVISSFFGVGDGWGFYNVDGIGLLLCVAGVALASFSLALDFDAIEQAVSLGVPERESWRAALGLVITLVWLYLEILRFLAILNSD
jgi:uncharacterized YccA/Bax inhibitor family protein